MSARPVAINARTLAAHGLSGRELACVSPGAVVVLPDATAWRVTEGGSLDPVQPFGFKSIASDPAAGRVAR